MFIKHLLKGVCFALFASVTLAKEEYTGDCKEIEEYISKKQLNIDDIITKCVVNEEGKVTILGINDRYLREWSVKRLLSYPTITELNYLYYCDKNLGENSEDILVDGDVNEYPPPDDPNAYKSYAWVMNARSEYCYKDIYPKIDKLVNLKKYELEINYIKAKGRIIDSTSNNNHFTEEISSNIEEITLRYVGLINYDVSGFTNIKTLKIYNSSFENLQNIEKLTNLTTLILNDCVYDQEDIEKIKNLENIKVLIIDGKNIIGNGQDDNGSTSDENPDNNDNNNESNDDGTDDNNESNNNDDESCDDEDENDDDDESCDEEDEDDDDDESCDDDDDDNDNESDDDDDDDNDSESDDDDDDNNDSESDDDEVEVDNDDGQSNNGDDDDDDEDDSNDDSE